MPIHFAGAEKKLRQAELFRDYMQMQSREIAKDMRRSGSDRDYRFGLETFCSASLGAARSSYFVLCEGGPEFKLIDSEWRKGLDQESRTRFNALLKMRDRDVHYGELPGEALPKMIPMEHAWNHGWDAYSHNPVHFGPQYLTQHTNPDGATVHAYGLQSSVGLYVEICGQRIEATTACTDFISQLRSLLQAAKAAGAATPRDEASQVV